MTVETVFSVAIRGGIVKVDAAGLALMQGKQWRVNSGGYVVRTVYANGKCYAELLHRVLMSAQKGQVVDHIDGDKLNNLPSNLRLCSHAENARNRRRAKHNTSGFKGIYFDRGRSKWRAQIQCNGRRKMVGRFDTQEAAHAAYCEAAQRLHGEFARFA
jgi:hypothetical protein